MLFGQSEKKVGGHDSENGERRAWLKGWWISASFALSPPTIHYLEKEKTCPSKFTYSEFRIFCFCSDLFDLTQIIVKERKSTRSTNENRQLKVLKVGLGMP